MFQEMSIERELSRASQPLQVLVRSPAVALQREMCGHHYMSWCQLARSFCMLKQGQVMMAAAATASPSGPLSLVDPLPARAVRELV